MGPKPTAKQLETLTKLALPGVTVHEWSETRGGLHAYIGHEPRYSGQVRFVGLVEARRRSRDGVAKHGVRDHLGRSRSHQEG